MLILDFRTGKMTKMALDLRTILAPGVAFGLSGAWIGGIIDRLAGTDRDWKWSKRLGLTGLIGGLGLGVFNALPPPPVPTFKAPTKHIQALLDKLNKAPEQTDKQQYGTHDISDRSKLFMDIMTPPDKSGYLNIALYRATAARSADNPAVERVLKEAKIAATRRIILDMYISIFWPELRNDAEAVFNGYLDFTGRALQYDVGSDKYAHAIREAERKLAAIAKCMRMDKQFELASVFTDPMPLIKELEKRQPK